MVFLKCVLNVLGGFFLSCFIFLAKLIYGILLLIIGLIAFSILFLLPLYFIYRVLNHYGLIKQIKNYKEKKRGNLVAFTYESVVLLLDNSDYTWDFKSGVVSIRDNNRKDVYGNAKISNFSFYMPLKDKLKAVKYLRNIDLCLVETMALDSKREQLKQNLILVQRLEQTIKLESERIDSELSVNYTKYAERVENLGCLETN